MRHTQRVNNRAYCLDETSWFDLTLVLGNGDVLRFVKLVIAWRLMRDIGPERRRVSLNQMIRGSKHIWHGVKLDQPDWNPGLHTLALNTELRAEKLNLHLIFNAYWQPLDSQRDIVDWQATLPVSGQRYRTSPPSLVALITCPEFEN